MNSESHIIFDIAKYVGVSERKVQPNSNVLYDLRVDGNDALELVDYLSKKYSFTYNVIDVQKCFGSEGDIHGLAQYISSIFTGRKSSSKFGLKVKDLLAAAQTGHLIIEP